MTRQFWLLAALPVAAILPTLQQSTSLTVAIARPDGYLVPFAAYTDGQWARAWPAADEGNIDHPTLENTPSVWRRRGQPVPRTWHVWPIGGKRPLVAHVSGLEAVEAHCVAQVALKSDLQPMNARHPDKLGVAIDSDRPLVAIEGVPKSDSLWKRAERAIAPRFSQLEAQRAQARHLQLPSETPPPATQITALYGELRSPRSPMYFVAEKRYRTARISDDPQCNAVTIMTGWLRRAANDSMTVGEPRIFITDCDGMEVRVAEPLAAIHLSDRLFWILQEHGWEDESYVVAEIGATGIQYRVSVNGGGC